MMKLGLFQESKVYFNIGKSIYHYHITNIKEKKDMNISINVEKGFDTQQEEFIIVNSS